MKKISLGLVLLVAGVVSAQACEDLSQRWDSIQNPRARVHALKVYGACMHYVCNYPKTDPVTAVEGIGWWKVRTGIAILCHIDDAYYADMDAKKAAKKAASSKKANVTIGPLAPATPTQEPKQETIVATSPPDASAPDDEDDADDREEPTAPVVAEDSNPKDFDQRWLPIFEYRWPAYELPKFSLPTRTAQSAH